MFDKSGKGEVVCAYPDHVLAGLTRLSGLPNQVNKNVLFYAWKCEAYHRFFFFKVRIELTLKLSFIELLLLTVVYKLGKQFILLTTPCGG